MTNLKNTANEICFKTNSKAFGFNKNLINITASKFGRHTLITFKFRNITAVLDGIKENSIPFDYFSIGYKGCDLNHFEEFADSCLFNFKGSGLEDEAVKEKAKALYHKIITLVEENKQRKRLNAFLSLERDMVNSIIHKASVSSFSVQERIYAPAMAY